MKRLALAAAAIAAALALPACAAGVGSLARVTVIDRTANRELPVYWKDGRAWIAGHPGNEYTVRVRNVAGEDLLAVVSVDGVNVVSGETARVSQSGYVVGSYHSLDVSGWRKSLSRTAAFYFTTLPDSYAARTGRPDDVGVIGVALFRRKPPEPVAVEPWRPSPFAKQESAAGAPAAPPAAERSESRDSAAKRARPGDPLGTGHGRSERNPAQWVEFERESPYPVETIVIHYDSTANLVAQGVIRPRYPRPRNPNPFPGFVPDPVS
ncbi:MAG: hypothetical protein KF776_02600 [Burkholderiales bacterium]|nr:hypothetical protein [Burkholderiales bacterium]